MQNTETITQTPAGTTCEAADDMKLVYGASCEDREVDAADGISRCEPPASIGTAQTGCTLANESPSGRKRAGDAPVGDVSAGPASDDGMSAADPLTGEPLAGADSSSGASGGSMSEGEDLGADAPDAETAADDAPAEETPPAASCHNAVLGERGEEAAARFLERRGMEILERNWKCFAGEADIIARDEDAVHFVEVKTRSNVDCGFPSEAVNHAKRERYERIAVAYLTGYDVVDVGIMFDIISIVVTGPNRAVLRYHRNAFCGCE